jgi:hypothetical protein
MRKVVIIVSNRVMNFAEFNGFVYVYGVHDGKVKL